MGNPFVFGSATSGEQFTDRVQDAERLLANFKHGVSVILISPRRWGKTSLVQKVSAMAQSKDIKVVNLDIFSCRNAEDFYQLFATEVIKQTANKWEEWAENAKKFLSALIPKISFGIDPNTDFSVSLDFSNTRLNDELLDLPQKIAKDKGFRIVVCIDEFQQIAEFLDHVHFQKKLRSVWQLQTEVSYCLYGSKKHVLSELFSNQSMPFYKFGDIFFLQKISTDDWITFICERFRSTGKSISAELARKICDTVENHSSYVQQLAWNVWIKTKTSATSTDVDAALIDLFNQNSMLYYRYIEGLSGFQINFLRAVADGKSNEFTRSETLQNYHLGTSANVKRLKDALEKKELIDITGRIVSFNDPVFKIWFQKNIRKL
ncbi:putative ATPase [Paludibacter propionicigenes WB4]|uniref:Putative ATPase n=1 Tax=Paludibacter propionicigenes (strain DSM 17365 / JCM 13257 / WB4) TaxID=694427 RepID=E4T6R8_PALPW|nr:AAA family ATPase [Paludibacter propionicigenes]ADQ80412.1 putative ATPase [Paludibacter propionicigenes WB4]